VFAVLPFYPTQGIDMRKSKVVLDFVKLLVAIKVEFYLNLIDKLTGNIYFVASDVPLSALSTAVANIQTAMLAAEDGGYTAKSHLRDVVKEADLLYIREARYIDRISNGDETMILSSGFHASKQPTPFNKPPIAATDGEHIGSVKLVGKQAPNGRSCIWQMYKGTVLTEDAVWVTIATTTAATYIHQGLESAQYYFFRMAIVTPEGTTDFCEPIRKLVV
jgi:hypothetical protein